MSTTINKGAITGMDLSAYFVSDPKRSIAFYRDVLGIQPTAVDDEGRGAEFTLADGQTFGVWNSGDDGPKSGGCMMFTVADVNAAVARIRASGGTVGDPNESPVCFMAFGSDPDGNAYIVHQRKS
jgi:predicted enzyme related to lactoylglutathione lyase